MASFTSRVRTVVVLLLAGRTVCQDLTPSCPCGRQNVPDSRITGGHETGINEFPFMAALLHNNAGYCGATILTEYHAVTATHCIRKYYDAVDELSILVGAHNRHLIDLSVTPDAAVYQVDSLYSHPNYDTALINNDITILVIDGPIKFGRNVGPACLPPQDLLLDDGDLVTAIGWGATSAANNTGTDLLMEVSLDALNSTTCKKTWKELDTSSQVCFLSPGKGFCPGDSGGPVVWRDPKTELLTLIGIPSFINKCGDSIPIVATNVGYFVDFITETIRTSTDPPGAVAACSAYQNSTLQPNPL